MRVVTKSKNPRKRSDSMVPNIMAYTFVRSFLTDAKFKKDREVYFKSDLTSKEINMIISEVKWLARNYKGLEVIQIEENNTSEDKTYIIL